MFKEIYNESNRIEKPVETPNLIEPKIDGITRFRKFHQMNENYENPGFVLEMEKNKELFRDTLELSNKDLDMLKILFRFNKDTFEHSIRTLTLIKNKIRKPLEKGIVLSEGIEKEVKDMEVFYRACLFHDIGKIAIPEFVLTNNLNDQQWANILLDLISTESDSESLRNNIGEHSDQAELIIEKLKSATSASDAVTILDRFNLRPCHIVPVKYGLSEDEVTILQNDFGINPATPLWSIMNKHELESSLILEDQNFPQEAEIAKDHGNKSYQRTPIASTSLHIGSEMSYVRNLVYLADVQEAMLSGRDYKDPLNKLKVIAHLVSEAEKGKIDKTVAHLWIQDDINLFTASVEGQQLLAISRKNDKELRPEELEVKNDLEKDLATIHSFLDCLCIV